jgi:5'-3' exonuclease
MGIKYFFKWFKESFPNTIVTQLPSSCQNKPHLLLLDLNGIIHTSCQKIYRYGSFEPKNLLRKSPPIFNGEKDLLVFEDVVKSIDNIILTTNPKEIVLCIDGVAPISKQIQQRQRRFNNKAGKINGGFDSNCISPGTEFLYKLGNYLKSQLELKLESEWLNVTTIYFMDSLVPGEGEHKLFDFLRSNRTRIAKNKFNIIIWGNDADLIMLSLLVSTLFLKENLIYILREERSERIVIDISLLKKSIHYFSKVKPEFKYCNFERVICDFVTLCFMVGNDFLPQLPLFNIYDGGLDLLMKFYFSRKDYIVYRCPRTKKNKINFQNLKVYFEHITSTIIPHAINHYKTREYGFQNTLLDTVLKKEENWSEQYLKSYSSHYRINKNLTRSYLEEIEWVLNYYSYGSESIDWELYYPSQFAPTSLDLLLYLKNNRYFSSKKKRCLIGGTFDPFFQLLCILPPSSADLLPQPLNKILVEDLGEFHPQDIKIDYNGKLNEWEGIPILPPLDYTKIFSIYKGSVNHVSKENLKRNTKSSELTMSVC